MNGRNRKVYIRRKTVFQTHSETWRWNCFASSGVGHLYRIDSTLTKEKHHSILQTHVPTSGCNLCGEGFILRQDNEPKHTPELGHNYWRPKKYNESWLSWTFLHSHLSSAPLDIYCGTWRLRNPSNLWHHKRLCGTRSCWDNTSQNVLHRLVECIPA